MGSPPLRPTHSRAAPPLLLLLLLLLLTFSAAADSQQPPADDDLSVNQHIVSTNLHKAISAISDAHSSLHSLTSLDHPLPLCKDALAASLLSLHQASTHAASLHWDAAKSSVSAAIRETHRCFEPLLQQLDAESDHIALPSSLSFYASEAEHYLKAAENELDIITSPLAFEEDESAYFSSQADHEVVEASTLDQTSEVDIEGMAGMGGCPKSEVDGTKCPFTECGKGHGLVTCAIGYARGVVGGMRGQSYVVTSDDDNPLNPSPGTLRYGTNLARNTAGGLWITFSRSMIITLRDMLWVQSHTTIDGRDRNITIVGRNLVLGGVTNVIIHNIQISHIRGSDTLHIFSGTTKVWVDHLTSFAGELGLASVLQGSTDVTISNSNLFNYNFNMLLGASDADSEDKAMRVTVYRNYFHDSMQRMPHCRWGMCHVVNNYYVNWGYYCIGGRANARVRSEHNVFHAGPRSKEVTPWFSGTPATFDMSARIESHNDVLLNGATFHQFLEVASEAKPSYQPNSNPPIAPTSHLPDLILQCSGALMGARLRNCLSIN